MADETISIELGAKDSISPAADAAAASVEALDATHKALSGTLDGLRSDYDALRKAARNATDPDTFLQLKGYADKAASAINKVEQELKDIESERDAVLGVARAEDKASSSADRLASNLDDVAAQEGGVSTLSASVASFAGNVLAKAAEKAAELGVELAKALAVAVVDADKAKRATMGLLDVYTDGQGQAYFEGLSRTARAMGRDVNEVAREFADFREAGVDAATAVEMVKLKSDIEALLPGTGRADAAMSELLERIKSGEDASAVMAELAAKFRVAGDGSAAAAVSSRTMTGALDAMKAKGMALIATLADRLAPTVTGLIDRFATWAESPEGMAAIETTITAIARAVELSVPVVEALGNAFLSLTGHEEQASVAGGVVAGIVQALAAPFFAAVNAIDMASSAWDAFSTTTGIAVDAVSAAASAVGETVSQWVQLGADLVQGFIDGITGKIGDAVAAVQGMAAAVADGFHNSVLNFGSPSRLMGQYAAWTVEGYEDNLDQVDIAGAMGLDAAAADVNAALAAVNDNVASAAPTAPAAAPAGGGNVTINVTVDARGATEAAAQSIAVQVRNELQRVMSGLAASGGLSASVSGRRAA